MTAGKSRSRAQVWASHVQHQMRTSESADPSIITAYAMSSPALSLAMRRRARPRLQVPSLGLLAVWLSLLTAGGGWSAGMLQLEDLDLGWCCGITDADVKALAALTAITGLELSRTLVRHRSTVSISFSPATPDAAAAVRMLSLVRQFLCLTNCAECPM